MTTWNIPYWMWLVHDFCSCCLLRLTCTFLLFEVQTLDLFDEPIPTANLSLRGMACRNGHVSVITKLLQFSSLLKSFLMQGRVLGKRHTEVCYTWLSALFISCEQMGSKQVHGSDCGFHSSLFASIDTVCDISFYNTNISYYSYRLLSQLTSDANFFL